MDEKTLARFWSKVDINGPLMHTALGVCWAWTAYTCNGYGVFRFAGINWRAHRFSYSIAHPGFDMRHHVLHRCDNPACVNPAHLFLGTDADNIRDMCAKGRHPRGQTHGNARLTDAQIRSIRERYVPGSRYASIHALARAFGMSSNAIAAVVQRRTWKHI